MHYREKHGLSTNLKQKKKKKRVSILLSGLHIIGLKVSKCGAKKEKKNEEEEEN